MSPEKSWKATERRVAAILGGERVPVNGRIRGSAPDVAHDKLALEIKHRQSIPRWIEDALAQAEASAATRGGTEEGDMKLAVAVLHGDGARYERSLCLLRLEDLAELLERRNEQ